MIGKRLYRYRSAITGQFIAKARALLNPMTSVREYIRTVKAYVKSKLQRSK